MGGDALRSLRESLRITADDLGALLGYTGSAIRNWETGHRKPDVTDLQRMAEFFEIDIDDLLAGKDMHPARYPPGAVGLKMRLRAGGFDEEAIVYWACR